MSNKKCGAKKRNGAGTCQSWGMSNGRCRMHGGKSLNGIASPNLKEGRYSKYLPQQLQGQYKEFLNNPDLLDHKEGVALVQTLLAGHIKRMADGDTNPAWVEAHAAQTKLDKAIHSGDADKLIKANIELKAIISQNYIAAKAESQAVDYVEKAANLADKERRAMVAEQQMMSVEQILLLLTSIILGFKAIVESHCDKPTSRKILIEAQALYDTTTNSQ